MKRYSFRMQKVLRVRELQEEIARAGVAAARATEQQSQSALDVSLDHYCGLDTTAATPQSASVFLGLRDQASYRAGAVNIAKGNRAVAAQATAAAVSTWHESNRRVGALERLDERRREEYAIEARRYEDAAADEIVVARARSGA